LTYDEAIARYGTDKPDLRFGLELHDLTDLLRQTEFQAFRSVIEAGGIVKAICLPGCADYSRKQLDELTEFVKRFGAKGLATIAFTADGVRSPIAKFLAEGELQAIRERTGAQVGDLLAIVADAPKVANECLSRLRHRMGQQLGLADPNLMAFAWVVDFPLLEWDEEGGSLEPVAPPVHLAPRGRHPPAGHRPRQGTRQLLRPRVQRQRTRQR
jgi:aspartyl-tRNA synthetase